MKPIVADLHMHSIMSGHAFGTIRELAQAAAERGLKLIGVTEHGPGIPGTVEPIYFRNLIDAPRILYGVQMLYGSEVNIRNDGTLTLDEHHMSGLDYAIAGIHAPVFTDAGIVKNTDAVIACMEHPKVKFISHPDSDNYPLDYPALAAAAKETGTALEVNNSSLRKPNMRPGCEKNYCTLLPLCMELQVPLIVNTDSHDPATVGDFTLAMSLLQRLGVGDDLILNNDLVKLKSFLLG